MDTRMPAAALAIIAILAITVTPVTTDSKTTSVNSKLESVTENVRTFDKVNKPKVTPNSFTIFDGVNVEFPRGSNETNKLFSIELDMDNTEIEGRGRGKSKQNLMQRLLPLFIMPFIIQSTIVPFFLSTLKFMLFKSMMVGKLALALIIFNAFKNHNSFRGRDAEVADVHYGYHGNGMEEYGAYVN